MRIAEAWRVRIEGATSVRPAAWVTRLHHVAPPGSARAVDGSRNRMIAEVGGAPAATAPAPVRAPTPGELRAIHEAADRARAQAASARPAGTAAAAYLRAGAASPPGRLFDIRA